MGLYVEADYWAAEYTFDMVFIVEDGTGIEDANSYVSLAYADNYFLTTSDTTWPQLTDTEKEVLLVLASQYADVRWGTKLRGQPLVTTQALEFPRKFMYDRYGRVIEGVPDNWKSAVCEYAIIQNSASLYPQAPGTAKEIKSRRVTVGPITTQTEYLGTGKASGYQPYPYPDSLAKAYITSGLSGSGQLIRN